MDNPYRELFDIDTAPGEEVAWDEGRAAARREAFREAVEALRAEARGRTPHADRDARVIAGIREGADLIEHLFLSHPDNPEATA